MVSRFVPALVLALLVFCWGVYVRLRKYRRGRAVNRFDRLPARIVHAPHLAARSVRCARTALCE